MDLDHIDLAVVRELQADGRLTYETLAQRVGLSRPATRARVQRLLEGGGVLVAAVVHPAVRGLTASAHLSIGVRGPAGPVARAIAAMPEAPFVTLTAAWLRGHGRAAHEGDRRSGPGDRTRPLPAGRRRRGPADLHPPPQGPVSARGELTVTELDETDQLVLRELEADGRLPFAELAERVGLSAGAARARTLRLLDGGVAKVLALVRPELLGLGILCGFAVRVEAERDEVAARLAEREQVSFLSSCVGRADLVGTITVESLAAIRTAVEDMRAVEGVRAVESWVHLELVKERYEDPTAE